MLPVDYRAALLEAADHYEEFPVILERIARLEQRKAAESAPSESAARSKLPTRKDVRPSA